MTSNADPQHRSILKQIAHRVMMERGLLPDFTPRAMHELKGILGPATTDGGPTRDLRSLPWCSIDNDDSLDLDQLSVAIPQSGEAARILVGIADVDALVKKDSALDNDAGHNTTSVYTAAETFPMLPERLSTDLTSLAFGADRLAVVVDMTVAGDGSVQSGEVYRALVHNRAKLAYDSVAGWLEGSGPMPRAIGAVDGLADNLGIQDRVAQRLKALRLQHGALTLETIETRPVFEADQIRALEVERKNRAKDLIEDFMIAANGVTARYLASRNFPSLRRVVRTPRRWDRIVELAAEQHFPLPEQPDPRALDRFLASAKASDPLHFPDLSLSVIKLLGPGEYAVEYPGGNPPGHFGLAVKDYAHSTAPNRRYPDLITQRLLKAAMLNGPLPYSSDELETLARHCTEEEDAVKKVERQVEKSAAALLLRSRVGETFDAIVTGASEKGTWVRVMQPPVEGKLVAGFEGMAVGNRLRVQLIHTDVERGFIDFKKVHTS